MPVLRAIAALILLAFAASAQEGPAVYEVDALNTGLGDPPGFIDRSTPRATIESLLFAAQSDRWEAAAHLLDLSAIDEAEQAEAGADLARKLERVVDRKAVIDWDDLLDRPDALDAQASNQNAMAGQPRKSILIWTLDLGGRPAAIRLNRLQAGDDDPVWVFARQTVENIDALYRRHGPSDIEKMFPAVLRQDTGFGLLVWELLGLPLLLGAAALLGWAVHRTLAGLARWVDIPVINDILRAVRGPAVFGAVVGLVAFTAGNFFVFSGRIDTILQPLIAIGLVGSLMWLIVNAIDAVLDRLVTFTTDELSRREMQQAKATATRVAAGRRALIVVFVALAIGVAMSSTSLYQNLGLSLIGTAGALTLILGFAARRILGNIMSSLQIALNQSARIGDRVVYKDHLCHVERINFTFVQLRDWDGTRLVVPVEEFVTNTFQNWTMQDPDMLRIIKIKTAHDADVERMRRAFYEIVEELSDEDVGDREEATVRVAGQDAYGKDVWFCLPCTDPNTSWDVACKARERIMERGAEFERQGDVQIFPRLAMADAA